MAAKSRTSSFALLTAAFVASRILYYSIGVQFDAAPLDFYNQYIDPLLLRHDLWRSLFYLKEQPPLFNLFLGSILQLFPNHSVAAFHFTFLCIGLALTLSLFALMDRMGVARPLAVLVALVFALNPATILYEAWLFYEYPLTALLCAAALFLHRYASGGRTLDGSIFFCCLAAIAGIRSVYHLAWFAAIAAVTCVALRPLTRRTLAVMAVPGLLLAMLYAKNLLLFGSMVPGGEAFGGTNLARLATRHLAPDKIRDLIAQGKISSWVLTTDIYEIGTSAIAKNVPDPPRTGIPVRDDRYKSNGGLNWNSTWFGEVGKLYRKDALTVLREYPENYVNSAIENLQSILYPASEHWPFDGRSATNNLLLVTQPLKTYVQWTTGEAPDRGKREPRHPWISYVALPGLLGFGLWRAIRRWRTWNQPSNLVLLFMMFNIVYLSTAAVLLSDSDQNRYRDEVSAFFAALLGLALTAGWKMSRPAKAGRPVAKKSRVSGARHVKPRP